MPFKFTITASLTPEVTAFFAAKVASGHYHSASEVVRAAKLVLVEQDRQHELGGKAEVGEQDAR
jgi:putative addiction module CopG family antidote